MEPWRRTGWMVAMLVALGVLLNLPYLFAGYSADDLLLINLFRADPLPFSRWMGVWSGVVP